MTGKMRTRYANYLRRLLHKEAFDRRGLIYGMGHAIYSVSDPRAEVLKSFVESLAKEKGRMKDYNLYSMVEKMAPEVIAEERRIYKGVSANVDFLQWICVQYAGSSSGALYTDVCGGTYCGLERSSYGGADQYRQDHSSRIQKCAGSSGICAA